MPRDHVKAKESVNTTIRFSRRLWQTIGLYADDVGASRQSSVVILLREALENKGYGWLPEEGDDPQQENEINGQDS